MRLVIALLTISLCNGVIAASAYWSGISVIDDGYYKDEIAQYYMGGYSKER